MSSFFFSWLDWLRAYQLYWSFQRNSFCFYWLARLISFFHLHWIVLWFFSHLYLLIVSFNCSFFSTSLRCKFRWLISSFLVYVVAAISFPLSTAFTESHEYFIFSFYEFFLQLLFLSVDPCFWLTFFFLRNFS